MCAASMSAQSVSGIPAEKSGRIMIGDKSPTFSFAASPLSEEGNRADKVIAKAGATGSTIYGYQSYADIDGFVGGLYEIEPSGDMTPMWEYDYASIGAAVNSGWIRNGRLCGLGVYTAGSEDLIGDYAYQEFDLTTGKMLASNHIETEGNLLPYFYTATYVAEDDRIYGFGRIGDPYHDTRHIFKSAPADRPDLAEMIVEVNPGDRCYSLCWHPVDRCLYGVNTWGKLVKIDLDGTYTVLCDLGFGDIIANAPSALTYSPYDGYLLWNPTVQEAKSSLYAIYPQEKIIEKLHTFDVDRQFTFFTSSDFSVDAAAPASATYIGADFDKASLSGNLRFRLPALTYGGEALSGEINYTLYADGSKINSGKGNAGTEVTIPATMPRDAYYTFRLEAETAGKSGVPCVVHKYVGNDIPAAPANVVLNSTEISWDAVTKGTHNAYIDAAAMEYKVYLNDKYLGTTTSTVYPYTLDLDHELDAFTAKVVAVCNGMFSDEGVSEKTILGRPLTLPVTILPTEHQAELCTYVNRDGSPEYGTWRLSDQWGDLCFASGWSYETADDWLILPVTSFPDADKVYSVSIEAARGGTISSREYFEVWVGNAPDPEAMTICAIEKTRAQKFNEWIDYSGIFAIPAAGNYYVAVHGVSDPDQKDLIVKNIRIKETEFSKKSPEAVTDLKVVSSSNSDLTATISMTMPTKYINGAAIENGVKIKAIANVVKEVSVEGNAGETVTLTVPTKQGDNYINVVTAIDNAKGRAKEVVVFTGMDMLSYVENLSGEISEDNMSVHLTWGAPKESLNGGYFEKTGIIYNIGVIDSDGTFLSEPIRTEADVNEHTLVCPKGTPQQFCRIAVVPENAAGMSHAVSYITQIVGTPHSLPIKEDFENLTALYQPVTTSSPTSEYANGKWTIGQPELVNPGFTGNQSTFAMVGYTEETAAKVRLRLPKVSTSGLAEAYATFEVWTGFNCADPIDIYAITYGMKSPEKIATLPLGNGWQYVTVAVPEKYLDRPWMNLYIDGKLKSAEHFLLLCSYSIDKTNGIDDITVANGSISSTDGNISITGFAGKDYSVTRIDGIVVASGISDGNITVPVSQGIYIVKAGDHTTRMMVR